MKGRRSPYVFYLWVEAEMASKVNSISFSWSDSLTSVHVTLICVTGDDYLASWFVDSWITSVLWTLWAILLLTKANRSSRATKQLSKLQWRIAQSRVLIFQSTLHCKHWSDCRVGDGKAGWETMMGKWVTYGIKGSGVGEEGKSRRLPDSFLLRWGGCGRTAGQFQCLV